MDRRDSSRPDGQRRPRLLRACATEPSIVTTSAVSQTTGSNVNGGAGSRRATDILNQVAYISSCATSPVAPSFGQTSPLFGLGQRRGSQSTATSPSQPRRSGTNTTNDVVNGGFRRESEDLLASSPTSTNTSESIDDMHVAHTRSGNYFSFPSFDTWDPDNPEREQDGEEKMA